MIFNPAEEVMYPLRGDLQDLSLKRGVEVDVKGWGDVMEGASRRKSLFLILFLSYYLYLLYLHALSVPALISAARSLLFPSIVSSLPLASLRFPWVLLRKIEMLTISTILQRSSYGLYQIIQCC